jgi:hypothetical protein
MRRGSAKPGLGAAGNTDGGARLRRPRSLLAGSRLKCWKYQAICLTRTTARVPLDHT